MALFAACEAGDIRGQHVDWPDASQPYDASDFDPNGAPLDASPRDAAQPVDSAVAMDAAAPQDAGPRDAAPPMDASNPADAAPSIPKLAVTFDPPGRGFSDVVMLKLSAAGSGDEVHYTLDGSLPSATSPEPTGPIAISATTLVRAIATRDGVSTPVVNQSYFQLDPDVQSFRRSVSSLAASG